MRTLYNEYYKEKNRGFTDKEFRDVCEKTAGKPLDELFDIYIPTTREIDYAKYLAYAGLSIDTEPIPQPGGWLGTSTRQEGDNLMITRVEWDSPAYKAGLSFQDVINEVDGMKLTASQLEEKLSGLKKGDKITISVTHRENRNTLEIILGEKTIRSFEIKPMADPTPQQSAILDNWLR